MSPTLENTGSAAALHKLSLPCGVQDLPRKSASRSVSSDSLQPHGLHSPRRSPDHSTGVGSPFPSEGAFPNPGIEPRSPAWQADSFPAESPGTPGGLPRPRIKPTSPALAGGLFTTGPPRKSLVYFLKMKRVGAYLGIMQVWFHTVYVNSVTKMLWVPTACRSDAYTRLQSSE